MPMDLLSKFVVGFCGAAFTLYSNIGGDLPGMGKSTAIRKLTDRIEELKDKINDNENDLKSEEDKLSEGKILVSEFAMKMQSLNSRMDAWSKEILGLRDERSELRNSAYFQGALIFVILGGFFATFLTGGAILEGNQLNVQTILSAVAIGAGWTGIISRYMKTGEIKEENLDMNNNISEVREEMDGILKEKEKEFNEKLDTLKKTALEISGELDESVKELMVEKSKEFLEKLDFAKNETSIISKGYLDIVGDLMAKVEEGDVIVERFNSLKEAIKDKTIREELSKLGFDLWESG